MFLRLEADKYFKQFSTTAKDKNLDAIIRIIEALEDTELLKS